MSVFTFVVVQGGPFAFDVCVASLYRLHLQYLLPSASGLGPNLRELLDKPATTSAFRNLPRHSVTDLARKVFDASDQQSQAEVFLRKFFPGGYSPNNSYYPELLRKVVRGCVFFIMPVPASDVHFQVSQA